MRGNSLRARHARILGIGLGLSLVVHVLLLALGHVSFGTRGPSEGPLNAVSLPQPELDRPEPELSRMQSQSDEVSLDGFGFEVVSLEAAQFALVSDESVLGMSGEPLIPRPRIRPEREDHGFTPVRHMPSPVLSTLSGGSDGNGVPGVTFVFGGGGVGHGPTCHPSDIIGRIPSRRLPVTSPRLLTPVPRLRR